MQTAFCSYQESTSVSGSSFTRAVKGVRQRQGDPDGAVGIVALAHIQNARDARRSSPRSRSLKRYFAAGQRQHQACPSAFA